ncbi:MAG: HAMP domain-containing protein [Spirochaetales bacterium]|nr:HAMP domain-containing protein [Spirochaetales bacterium]
MLNERLNKPPRFGFIAVAVLYTIIVGLLLLFSSEMLKDISAGNTVSNFVFIAIIIIIPAVLFGIVLYQVIKTIRARRKRESGSRFRTRILVYFFILSFFSGIPQGILSINLISTAMTYWFAPDFEEALDGGIEIALQYLEERLISIDSIVDNPAFRRIAGTYTKSPERIWGFVRQNYPDISSMQIFMLDNTPYYFAGDERSRLDTAPRIDIDNGRLPRNDYSSLSVLRGIHTGNAYKYIFSSILTENFGQTAARLTKSLESFTQMNRYKTTLRFFVYVLFTLFSFPLFLISMMLAFLLTDEIVSPVMHLENATRRVANGDYSFRILGRKNDELFFLVDSFNEMVSQIERTKYQNAQSDKLAAWQEIAQRLAHEVKNPLTPIKLSAERILRKFENNEDLSRSLPRAVASIIREVENMDKLIQEFRDFSRTASLFQKHDNINKLISEAVSTYRSTYPDIQFQWEPGQNLNPFIDKAQIMRLLTNLIINAAEAMKEFGILKIRTDLVRKGNNEYCRIQIQDTGPGISEEIRQQIFNPYFTTKEYGTGLGLAIIERIVFDHAGSIWYESAPGSGTTFFVDLPMKSPR